MHLLKSQSACVASATDLTCTRAGRANNHLLRSRTPVRANTKGRPRAATDEPAGADTSRRGSVLVTRQDVEGAARAAPPPRTRARRRASRPRGASRRAAGPRSSGRRPRTSPRRPCLRGRRPRGGFASPPSTRRRALAASGARIAARVFRRRWHRAGEVQQRVRGPGVVRREPGEVVDGAAQGHEHVLALDVAAEHRARGPGRREARVGLLVRLRARLVAGGVRRVGRRERVRGDDASVPDDGTSRRASPRGLLQAPPRSSRRSTRGGRPAGRAGSRRARAPRAPAGAAAAAGAGAARTSGRCSRRAARPAAVSVPAARPRAAPPAS